MKEIKLEYAKVTYSDSAEMKDIVFQKIVDLFSKCEIFASELWEQTDDGVLYGLDCLGEIADMLFKVEYKEEVTPAVADWKCKYWDCGWCYHKDGKECVSFFECTIL